MSWNTHESVEAPVFPSPPGWAEVLKVFVAPASFFTSSCLLPALLTSLSG